MNIPLCSVCGDSHDEVVILIWEEEIKRISASDLVAELAYVERELSYEPLPERRGPLLHRKGFLLRERSRRGLSSRVVKSVQDRIDRAKQGCDLEGLVNLPIGHMNGNRTWMHCPLHGTDTTASLVVRPAANALMPSSSSST